MNTRDRNRSIEGARAIGAFVVLMWHLNHFLDPYFEEFTFRTIFRGEWANVFFFTLSGFLTSYTRYGKSDLPTRHAFVKKRIQKIYPLWFATILFFVVLDFASLYIRNKLALRTCGVLLVQAVTDIFLIQSWIPGYPYLFEMNGPGWFLSAMLLAWILTIPLLKCVRSLNAKQQMYTVIFLLLLQTVWTWLCAENKLLSQYATGVWWMYPLTSYLCGMIAGLKEHDRCVSCAECGFASILMLLGGLILCYYVTFHAFIAEYAVVICYMIYVIRLLVNEEHPLCNMMSNKYLVMIGSLSFEIYLIHIPVTRFFEFFGFFRSGLVTFCIIVATTILFAFIWQKMMSHLSRGKKWKIL